MQSSQELQQSPWQDITRRGWSSVREVKKIQKYALFVFGTGMLTVYDAQATGYYS